MKIERLIKNINVIFAFALSKKVQIIIIQLYKLDSDFYDWKIHQHCSEISSKLNMYDDAEYGVTDEDFQITIREEYKNLMSLYNPEVYEYEHFVYPDFEGQLKYVCEIHKVQFPC